MHQQFHPKSAVEEKHWRASLADLTDQLPYVYQMRPSKTFRPMGWSPSTLLAHLSRQRAEAGSLVSLSFQPSAEPSQSKGRLSDALPPYPLLLYDSWRQHLKLIPWKAVAGFPRARSTKSTIAGPADEMCRIVVLFISHPMIGWEKGRFGGSLLPFLP